MKRCSKCGEEKALEDFTRDKRRTDGHGSYCKPCATAYARQRYGQDLEQSRAQKRAYYAANREAVNANHTEWQRQWRKDNPELARQRATEDSRRFRETHPNYHRAWYEANIEKERARSRQSMRKWRIANPEAERQVRHRYRKNNAEAVKKREREKTYARRATENITVDHIVPLSRGGKHEASNLAPACFSCNSSKCDRLLSEWIGRAA